MALGMQATRAFPRRVRLPAALGHGLPFARQQFQRLLRHQPCGHVAASLHAVPSTLLIPLAARAGGGQGLPWLDCHDDHAAGLLDCLAVDARPYLADRATVVNVLWRTALLKAVGQAFFAQHVQSWLPSLCQTLQAHPRAVFYARLAAFTEAFISVESQGLDLVV